METHHFAMDVVLHPNLTPEQDFSGFWVKNYLHHHTSVLAFPSHLGARVRIANSFQEFVDSKPVEALVGVLQGLHALKQLLPAEFAGFAVRAQLITATLEVQIWNTELTAIQSKYGRGARQRQGFPCRSGKPN